MYRVCKGGGKLFSKAFSTGSYDGTFKDRGYVRLTAYEEIEDLVGRFKVNKVEMVSRTVNNRKDTIKEWLIYGTKENKS